MFADDDCPRFFASELSKNLRTLAIKAVAKVDVRRDRLLPPVAFDVPVFSNVAHASATVPVANSKRASGTHALLSWEISRCIKFRVNAAAGQEFRATSLFDDASVIQHDDLVKIVNSRQPVCGNQS